MAIDRQPSHRRSYHAYKLCALLDAADEFELCGDSLLRGTGLSRPMLDDPQIRTSVDQYLIACNNAIQLYDVPQLPFHVGRHLHLYAYGLYGFALLCSPTVRDGFTFAVRYHSLATPVFSIAWRETPDGFIWTLSDEALKALAPALKRFLLEQQLTQHITHVHDIAHADIHPRSVTVSLPEPEDVSLYAKYLNCPVTFGAEATEILYDLNILDERPPLTNRITLAMLRETCESLIGKAEITDGTAGGVARLLMERTGRFPSMNAVARELGMTARTLRRRLSDEGETFSKIFDRVRCDLATTYLSQSGFTVADIANLLGFDDATNFRRSFRRWTGKPPSSLR